MKITKNKSTLNRKIIELDRFRLPFLNLNLLVDNAFLAGGSCIILFDPAHKFNDYDVFLLSDDAYKHQRARLLENGFVEFHTTKYSTTFLNHKFRIKVQVIRWDGISKNIGEVISKFDIDACRIGTDGKILYYAPESSVAISTKNIGPLINLKNSGWTLGRLQKYEANGYNVKQALWSLFQWIRDTKPENDEYDRYEHYNFMEVVF